MPAADLEDELKTSFSVESDTYNFIELKKT